MADAATTPLRDRRGHFVRTAVNPEPSAQSEPEEQQPPDEAEAEHPDPLEQDESAVDDPLEETEAQAQRAGLARVQALLTEALRLGTQYGLVTRRPDGSIAIPGMQPANVRECSECTCPQCGPHNQKHWWCMTCNSGPHDWMLVKPQYERQTLKPGGIQGLRHACCSAQCAREYLASVGRQPSGVPDTRQVDPTLGLPMAG